MDDAADLLPRDQPRVFQDAEVLDEAREREPMRLRKLTHGCGCRAQLRQHRAARRVGQRVEHRIERAGPVPMRGRMLNHMVKYWRTHAALSSAAWRTGEDYLRSRIGAR